MKKTIFIFAIFTLAFVLAGCGTKKTASNTDIADTSTAVTTSRVASIAPQIDTTAIDSTYQTNYTQALTSVNTYLQNQAEFCAAIIDFPQSSIEFANQYFFFSTANNQVKDWYGVVEIDPLLRVAKRQLAAKKDYAETIKCVSTKVTTPPNFSQAYASFLQSFPGVVGTDTAKTQIALLDTVWRITAWDATGAVIATQDISSAAISASATATTTASSL